MSWSGPVAGAAPYPPQPYANGQPPYGQQQPYQQYGQQPAYGQYPPAPTFPVPGPPQRPPNLQPPKKKGNPIITRYPPPPGYRGPAQHQASFGANQYPNQYQPSQLGYAQAAAVPPAYPGQGYTAPPASQGYQPHTYGTPHPPAYPPQPYPQTQNYQWPQQGYPPSQPYPQAPNHAGGQGYVPPASNYPNYPSHSAPVDSKAQPYGQAASWPASNGQAPYPPTYQNGSYNAPPHPAPPGYDANATPTPATAHLVLAQAPQVSSQPSSAIDETKPSTKSQLFLAWDDWDFDFEGAIWPKSNEPVDPNLSLGVIIWHPAKQVTRALPSTFDLAEEHALQPTPEKLDNAESVSVYFMAENSHEAFLDVRQTDEWESIRDDPIFVVFTDTDMRQNLVSLEDCIAQRDRPDEYLSTAEMDDDEEMTDASWNVMDHLEHELSSTNGASTAKAVEHQRPSCTEASQEDILAKLGVTGVAKPPSEGSPQPDYPGLATPPMSLPEKPAAAPSIPPDVPKPPHRAHSFGGHRDTGIQRAPQRPYGSMSAGAFSRQRIPPPPPPPPEPQHSSWNQSQYGNPGYDYSRGSPARSEGSNHTMAGSDFEPEKPSSGNEKEISAVPAFERSDSSFSRKRSYEGSDHGDDKARQQDDHTKRKRRSQVDAAYSRR